jgi:hypothetical protein
MVADEIDPLPVIDQGSLRPYVSVLVLEGVDGNTDVAFSALVDVLRSPATARTRREVALVADGVAPGTVVEPMDEVLALVHEVPQAPSWHVGSGFLERRFVLTLAVRSGDLIAPTA